MKKVRTRFAPSPTGYMHVGNLRSALFAYLIARHYGGEFILRIEDTDRSRYVEGAVEFIYDIFNKFGLKIDEGPNNEGKCGPYIQSERLPLYKKYAEELVKMGKAYYCFCSEERLEKLRKEAEENKVPFLYDKHCLKLSKEEVEAKIKAGIPYVIRQNIPDEGITEYDDLVYGHIAIENRLLEDQILIKSDNYPTYNYANVIDDHLMGITHVTRGNEYLSSTPKYLLLYEAFGWESPVYIHMPHVIKTDGTKISKRNKDDNLIDLLNDGYLPEAIINYLAFLGWSPEDNEEILSLDELIKKFDIKRISKSSGAYDVMKLRWVNSHYIKKLDDDKLIELVRPHLENTYDLSNKSDEWIKDLILLYRDHLSYGKEIIEVSSLFFKEEISLDQECREFMQQEGIDETLKIFKDEISKIEEWNLENINIAINNTKEKSGAKGKMLYMPIRIKVTGQMHGPELPNTLYLLGKDIVLKRLN
ncbi:MAG: glutamate--tRNA ligase [Mollicutes bacterium]|nr:glutamate--tRNA ligase [Mollicutes bacterium]